MNCLAETMSVCESKLKGPCKKKDESVKWTESVHNIYFVSSGFRFGLKSIRAPYTGTFSSSKYIHVTQATNGLYHHKNAYQQDVLTKRNMVITSTQRIHF